MGGAELEELLCSLVIELLIFLRGVCVCVCVFLQSQSMFPQLNLQGTR